MCVGFSQVILSFLTVCPACLNTVVEVQLYAPVLLILIRDSVPF
jgi:hypothetical protein